MRKKVSTSQMRLRELMEKKKIKQADIARKTGIARSTVSYYLSGRREPRQDSIRLISQAFDVEPSWLMGFDVPMDSQEPVALEITKYHIGDNETMRDSIIKFVNYANEKDLNRISDYIKGLDQGEEKRMV